MSKPLELIWDIKPPSNAALTRIAKNVFSGLILDLIAERAPRNETTEKKDPPCERVKKFQSKEIVA